MTNINSEHRSRLVYVCNMTTRSGLTEENNQLIDFGLAAVLNQAGLDGTQGQQTPRNSAKENIFDAATVSNAQL